MVPKIIAHRGYSGVSPENTLSAFANAVDIGADMIELDVQMTGDGQVVVFYDNDLLRITGCEGTIADYTLEELQQMDAGMWFGPEFEGERIPTLAEVLELVRESGLNIYLELKDIGAVEGFEETVLNVVREYDMQDRCIMASFQYEYLRHFKELDESIQVLFNTSSASLTLAEEFPADYYGLHTEMITADLIEAVHNAGSQVYAWNVNTPVQMQEVRAMGVDECRWNDMTQTKEMLLSQSYQTTDSHLLSFTYEDAITEYTEPDEDIIMPEGMEQIQSSADGLYIFSNSPN